MHTISKKIYEIITTVRPRLLEISSDLASKKGRSDLWSKKEILGHLIDSTANNHQRIVRGGQNMAGDFPVYNQNRWVEVQHYQEMNWQDLIELFFQYNLHLCRVIDFLPQEALSNSCNIGKENPVTLEFVITDYLRHLGLHLGDILSPDA